MGCVPWTGPAGALQKASSGLALQEFLKRRVAKSPIISL